MVSIPLKNISQFGSSSQLLGEIKNVPNYQPDGDLMILDAEASSWRGCHGRCLRRGILWPSSSLSNGWMVGETMRRLAKDLGDQGCFGASMVRRNITIQKPGILGGDPISHQSYMFYYVVLFFENIYLKPKASKVLLFLADPHKGPLTEIGFQSRSRLNICFNSLC